MKLIKNKIYNFKKGPPWGFISKYLINIKGIFKGKYTGECNYFAGRKYGHFTLSYDNTIYAIPLDWIMDDNKVTRDPINTPGDYGNN